MSSSLIWQHGGLAISAYGVCSSELVFRHSVVPMEQSRAMTEHNESFNPYFQRPRNRGERRIARRSKAQRTRYVSSFVSDGLLAAVDEAIGAALRCQCEFCLAEFEGRLLSTEDFWLRMQRRIARFGMVMQYVSGDTIETSWAYTIGRLRRGLPELVLVGRDRQTSAYWLKTLDFHWGELADDVEHARTVLGHREMYFALLPVPERVWETETYLLGAARDHFEQDLTVPREALQVVWADAQLRFPWEPQWSPKPGQGQPILGFQPPDLA
jgi:Domain of unknown function (DUF4262)